MYVHTRVKGPKGAISLPSVPLRSRESERQTAQLRDIDANARKQYTDIYPDVFGKEITVDLKIDNRR